MLVGVPNALSAAQVAAIRARLDGAGDAWVDGRATAGHQGAQVKRNLQIAEDAPIARELGTVILAALERNPLFLSAALPGQIYPPMFNRYEAAGGMHFGEHVDGAVRLLPGTASRSGPTFPRRCSFPPARSTTAESCRSRTPTARTTSSWAQVIWCFIRRPACIA